MTVAVVVKVFDGIVLAADSATTLPLETGASQVYNNANKVFHLHRSKPVGAMTWGLGSIGAASIGTLAKDLRRRLMGRDPEHPDWALTDDYTVQGVADRLVELMFDELYVPVMTGQPAPPVLGFLVAGYDGKAREAEGWLVSIDNPAIRPTPILAVGKDQAGWISYAQDEATRRLFNGIDGRLLQRVQELVPPDQHAQLTEAVVAAARQPAVAPMPFADAINLAGFMVDVTCAYTRYLLGPDTVGGPVEVAGISRHEGFKWVTRKHYYSPDLNPEDPHHDY